jgi:hypothetical protein
VTPEEKLAIQATIMDDFQAHAEKHPTLLIDVLLSGQGFAFVHQVLERRLAQAGQTTQVIGTLLRALDSRPVMEPPKPPDEDAA